MTHQGEQSPAHPIELAPAAVRDEDSRGRVNPDPSPPEPHPFERDRLRILNCMAFRRLMHKTQVFVTEGDDHFRTRLTHTLEVAAQAERLARTIGLNADLARAAALAHDLGHAPFGHAGEAALADAMADQGGFEHNRQSLRVVDYLEHPYPGFRGLNLTFELRESIVKHHTLYDQPDLADTEDEAIRPLLEAGTSPSLEGQAANLADGIAYTLHDVEDGLVACGLSEKALNRCEIWRDAARPIRHEHGALSLHAIRRPILESMAEQLIHDAATETARRLRAAQIKDVGEVRRQTGPLVALSESVTRGVEELQALLTQAVYRNQRVVEMDSRARRTVHRLFEAYLREPNRLPDRFRARLPDQGPHRVICDYVSGMTDRFCEREHERLCGHPA